MALGRPLSPLTLVPAERQRLMEWTRRPKTAQAVALRARVVLLCAEGRWLAKRPRFHLHFTHFGFLAEPRRALVR